jgi:hypothetical protein
MINTTKQHANHRGSSMELSTKHTHLTIQFDSGEVVTATAIVENIEKFNGTIAPQITSIIDYSNTDNSPVCPVELTDIVMCSVNETDEISWHSDLWGFEYTLSTQQNH